jgi:hypothetical protein
MLLAIGGDACSVKAALGVFAFLALPGGGFVKADG